MDIGSILLGLALLAVIAFIVARPFIEQTLTPEHPAGNVDYLLARRERVLTQLRDLDFDYAMSKINEEDYAPLRAQLMAEGVTILKQLDALGAGEPAGSRPTAHGLQSAAAEPLRAAAGPLRAAAATRDDEIEAAVAQLRARRAAAERPTPAKPDKRDREAEIEAAVAARRSAAAGVEKAGAGQLACTQCGAEVLPNDRFCPQCGSALTLACGNCGRPARTGDQFCARCGQALPAPTAGLRPAKAQG